MPYHAHLLRIATPDFPIRPLRTPHTKVVKVRDQEIMPKPSSSSSISHSLPYTRTYTHVHRKEEGRRMEIEHGIIDEDVKSFSRGAILLLHTEPEHLSGGEGRITRG